jgi:hypothetical protein
VCVFASCPETRAHSAPAVPVLVRAPVASVRRCARVGHLQYTVVQSETFYPCKRVESIEDIIINFVSKNIMKLKTIPTTHIPVHQRWRHTTCIAANQLQSDATLAGWLPASSGRLELGTRRQPPSKPNRAIAFLNPLRTKPSGVVLLPVSTSGSITELVFRARACDPMCVFASRRETRVYRAYQRWWPCLCGLLWPRRVDARVSATYGARCAPGGRRFLRDRKENRGAIIALTVACQNGDLIG